MPQTGLRTLSALIPLAHGAPSRVGRLRAYGNAVDAEATTDFIVACIEASQSPREINPPVIDLSPDEFAELLG